MNSCTAASLRMISTLLVPLAAIVAHLPGISSSGGAHKRSRGPAESLRFAAILLALAFLPAIDAWEVRFGGCTFRNGASGELQRSGSCSSEAGFLDLSWTKPRCEATNPKISLLTPGVFDGMARLE